MSTRLRPPRIVDRLRQQADQRFVGREAELAMVRQALAQDPPPFSVLIVHGPGGIGKTAFTERLRSLAIDAQMQTLRIDARDLDAATPDALLAALALALGLEADLAPDAPGPPTHKLLAKVLAAWTEQPRRLLIIDTFELLGHLETWLREKLLAELPEASLVVLAGRQPPSRFWLTDPVWSAGLRVVGLRNLTPTECECLLAKRQVDTALSEATLRLTYGHLLALTLVADLIEARGTVPDALDTDLIRQLTECLVSHVPSDLHRAALEVCACARATTQDLLAEVVDAPRAAELFEWLAGLGFVEAGPLGLFPHDLVRDAVAAELRWRHRSRALDGRQRTRAARRSRPVPALARGGRRQPRAQRRDEHLADVHGLPLDDHAWPGPVHHHGGRTRVLGPDDALPRLPPHRHPAGDFVRQADRPVRA